MIGMEKILNNIEFSPLQYCVTSILGSYCKYYGLDLFEDLMGRFWEFDFRISTSRDFFEDGLQEYHLNPMLRSYTQVLKEEFGIEFIELQSIRDKNDLLTRIKAYINAGYPIVASIDSYYLQHYESYMKYHGLNWNHYIIAYGYSDTEEKIYFIDGTRAFVKGPKHEISYSMFYEGIFPKHNIYRQPCELIAMSKIKEEKLNLGENLQFKQLHQIREFANELRLIGAYADEEFLKNTLMKLLNQVVLIGQHRWGNKAYLQKHIDPQNTQVNDIVRCWDKIKFALSPARKRDLHEKFSITADYVDEAANLEEVLYEALARKQQ